VDGGRVQPVRQFFRCRRLFHPLARLIIFLTAVNAAVFN
jgi:hypothetical protein